MQISVLKYIWSVQYACRKSLADKRPRVRGRFARNDESTEHPSHGNGHKLEDDDEVSRTISIQVPLFLLFAERWVSGLLYNTLFYQHLRGFACH